MKNILKYIPGFRSGKKYKMIIGAIYYIIALSMFTEGFGYGLFYLALPFMVFYFIDIFMHKKKSIPLKRAILNFIVSFVLVTISMVAIPDVEPASGESDIIEQETSQKSIEKEKKELSQTLRSNTEKSDEALIEEEVESQKETQETIQETDEVSNVEETETNKINVDGNGSLEVHFIDVGQADASLILCEGKSMLIDGGNPEDSSLIYSYLKKHGIDHLDYIVNTHPHADHVGGLAGALNYASVGTVLAPITAYDSRAFNSFVKYLDEQNVSITVPKAGDEFKFASARVKVLGPVTSSQDINNNSIVLKVTYGDTYFLFTGDAEREEEQDILAKGYDLRSTVLKVGHHGSNTSTTYPFLREIMPQYAVISVGKDNSYGHPSEDALSRLRDADVKTYRTDMQGDIICVSDGKDVTFTAERNADVNTLASVIETTQKSTPEPTTDKAQVAETQQDSTSESEPDSKSEASPVGVRYILNTNSKKIHFPDCHSVKKMSEKNKKETNLSKGDLIDQGYTSCGNCKP